MPDPPPNALDELVRQVRTGSKYRTVCEPVVRNIGRHELQHRRSLKEAVKATKNTLHQVAGAYLGGRMRYAEWEADLQAHTDDAEQLRAACTPILKTHASTRERLDILLVFYKTILGEIPQPRSILDVGCGLNPLTLPWMGLPREIIYRAYDLYTDQIAFLNHFFSLTGYASGLARTCDFATEPPTDPVDLALVLKVLPLLDHLPNGDGLTLLRSLRADRIVVSFPAYSLGGREKGMTQHYEARFLDLTHGESWRINRFEFATELAFIVDKTDCGWKGPRRGPAIKP